VGDRERVETARVDERIANADDTDALPAPAANLLERHVDDAQDLPPGGALRGSPFSPRMNGGRR